MIAAALLPLLVALQATAPPPADASLARIQARLAHPDALRLPADQTRPTFRVEVKGDRYWIAQPRAIDFTSAPMAPLTAPQTLSDPTIGMGGSPGGVNVLSAFSAVRRAVRERDARKTVAQELAEFCAAHDCSRR